MAPVQVGHLEERVIGVLKVTENDAQGLICGVPQPEVMDQGIVSIWSVWKNGVHEFIRHSTCKFLTNVWPNFSVEDMGIDFGLDVLVISSFDGCRKG